MVIAYASVKPVKQLIADRAVLTASARVQQRLHIPHLVLQATGCGSSGLLVTGGLRHRSYAAVQVAGAKLEVQVLSAAEDPKYKCLVQNQAQGCEEPRHRYYAHWCCVLCRPRTWCSLLLKELKYLVLIIGYHWCCAEALHLHLVRGDHRLGAEAEVLCCGAEGLSAEVEDLC